jgi:hypothetical protein
MIQCEQVLMLTKIIWLKYIVTISLLAHGDLKFPT